MNTPATQRLLEPFRQAARSPSINRFLRFAYVPLRHRIPRGVWKRLPVMGTFSIDIAEKRVRYCSQGEYLGRVLFWRGAWAYEPSTARALHHLAGHCKVFLDVGAYTGWFSLLASCATPSLQIHSFEPLPRNSQMLQKNLQINHLGARASIVEIAVSDHIGATELCIPQTPLPPTTASIEKDHVTAPSRTTEVPTISLDEYARKTDLAQVDLVKIDAEGAEERVLRGAHSLLRKHRPFLIVEDLEQNLELSAVWKGLEKIGYIHAAIGHERNRLAWPEEKDSVVSLSTLP